MKTAREILRAIVADVEAMKSEMPDTLERLEIPGESEHWFGPFEEGCRDSEDYSGYTIQWPNLGILIEEAKIALDSKSKASGRETKTTES